MTHRKAILGSIGAAVLALSLIAVASPAQAARAPIAGKAASAKVTKAVPGTITSVRAVKRDGLAAWAVTITREDGSIVVGYVDRRSGIVFDWTVQQAANEPIIDLDGPDRSRTAAPTPPSIGEPLPTTAEVDAHRPVPVPAGPAGPPAAPSAPAPAAAPAASDADDDGTDQVPSQEVTSGHHSTTAPSGTGDSTHAPESHQSHSDSGRGTEQPRSEHDHSSDDD